MDITIGQQVFKNIDKMSMDELRAIRSAVNLQRFFIKERVVRAKLIKDLPTKNKEVEIVQDMLSALRKQVDLFSAYIAPTIRQRVINKVKELGTALSETQITLKKILQHVQYQS